MKKLFLISIFLIVSSMILAQDDDVTVPDVTGLNIPQAAATLNAAGLRIGQQEAVSWTPDAPVEQNTISEQAIAPGETVPRGTAVAVTVYRAPNALLIYDDNDLTLVNQSGGRLPLTTITFRALDGPQASFNAAQWGTALDHGDCGQVWSIGRFDPKSLPECESINWLTTNNPAEHFWTPAGGRSEFAIYQNDIERGRCPVSAAGRCEVFLLAGGAAEITEYVYFAYTADRFIVVNQSDDQFMALPGAVITDTRGATYRITQPSAYGDDLIASTEYLAPDQCIHILNNAEDEAPPLPCTVIAEVAVNVDFIFWDDIFTYTSLTDGQPRTCPGATDGSLTICVLPR